MKKDERLYGKGVKVPKIPKDIIDERTKLLKAHLAYIMVDFPSVDNSVLNDILDAIEFWRKMGDDEARV